MTSPEQDHPDVDPRDLRICRYLDGSMPAEERAEFEREMLRDPSLHRETAAFAESDHQVAEALGALLTPSAPATVDRSSRTGRLGGSIGRFVAVAATLVIAVSAFVVVYAPNWATPREDLARNGKPSPDGRGESQAGELGKLTDNYTGGETRTPAGPEGLAHSADGAIGGFVSELDGVAGDIPSQPVTLSAGPALTCGDTPSAAATRDLAERLERERARCDAPSGVNVRREYIGVVDEDRGEVYMIQLDHVESDSARVEADL